MRLLVGALVVTLAVAGCGDNQAGDAGVDDGGAGDAGSESCETFAGCAAACSGELDCIGECLVAAPPSCAGCLIEAALTCSAQACSTVAPDLTCLEDCAGAPGPATCIGGCEALVGEWINCVAEAVDLGECAGELAACGFEVDPNPCASCAAAGRLCDGDGGCGDCVAGRVPAGEACAVPESCAEIDCGAAGECQVEDELARCECAPGSAVLSGMSCDNAMITNQLVTLTDGIVPVTFNQGGPRSESLCHSVTIAHSYAIQLHEVTIAEYGLCVAAGVCQRVLLCNNGTGVPDPTEARTAAHPMRCVDAKMAGRYCAWIGGRLPSESEWEYAAIGDRPCPTEPSYPWGDDAIDGNVANYGEDSNPFTAGAGLPVTAAGGPTVPVGFFDGTVRQRAVDGWFDGPESFTTRDDASPAGIAELAGNLAEWTLDCWHPSYDGAPIDGRPWGEGPCPQQVKKGEGWPDVADALQTWFRAPKAPGTIAGYMGFRCVVEPAP